MRPQLAEVDALTEAAQQQQGQQQLQQVYSNLYDEEVEQLSAYKEVSAFYCFLGCFV